MFTAIKTFGELSLSELYEILKVRSAVFVVEQNCPYQDLDDLDQQAYHLFSKEEKTGSIQAYLRILPAGLVFQDAIAIGRVLTTRRQDHLGWDILEKAIGWIQKEYPKTPIRLHAQCYASGFYEKAGFQICSDSFDIDGIPHCEMVLEAAEKTDI